MRRILFLVGMGFLLIGFGLLAAALSQDETPATPQATAPGVAAASNPHNNDTTQHNTVAALPDQQPIESACLDCHTNEAMLQALAEEDDTPTPPSEGSG